MSGEEIGIRRRLADSRIYWPVDWQTIVLVGLVTLIQGGAIVALEVVGELAIPEGQASNPEIGLGYVAIVVAETVALIGLYRLYQRFPEWLRNVIKKVLLGMAALIILGLWVAAGYGAFLTGDLPAYFAAVIAAGGCVGLVLLCYRYDLYWLLFNCIAAGLGIAVTALLGSRLAPAAVLPILLLTLLLDHFAVNLSEVMQDIVDLSSSVGIPNFLVIPNQPTIDFDNVVAFIQGDDGAERPPGLELVIGVGDFATPGLLSASAWAAGFAVPAVGALYGTIAAMVIMLNSVEGSDGKVPGLPWLNTGAMVGFGAGILVSGVPVMTVIA